MSNQEGRRTELLAMKARDLMRLATTLGIKGSWDMKKCDVVEAILRAESAQCGISAEVSNFIANGDASAKVNEVDEGVTEDVVTEAVKNEKRTVVIDMAAKMPYIEGAEVGTTVAFRLPNGKVKSARVAKKSTKNRRFMLETSYGAQYIVPYDDIVWVRTGKRWPRGVYRLLKGLVGDEKAAK